MEGYTDVMAAHQDGFENVVASLGTALTRGQIDLALKYGEAIALAYDVDLAGDSAAREGLLAQLGADHCVSKVRIIRLPAGKDPDELIRSNPDAWREAVANAKEVVGFAIDRLASEADLASVAGKRAFTGRVLAIIKAIPDPLERNFYVQQLAQRVNIEPGVLAEALQREPVRRPCSAPCRSARARLHFRGRAVPPASSWRRWGCCFGIRRSSETAGNGALPFRDAASAALILAWQERLAQTEGAATADLEGFVAGLDPASADLARDLLATWRRARRPARWTWTPRAVLRLARCSVSARRGWRRTCATGGCCWRRRSAMAIASGWQPLSNRSCSSVGKGRGDQGNAIRTDRPGREQEELSVATTINESRGGGNAVEGEGTGREGGQGGRAGQGRDPGQGARREGHAQGAGSEG